MNKNYDSLYDSIASARESFIKAVSNLSDSQVNFKPSKGEWSILNVTEHIVWAEQIGIWGMFSAVEGIKNEKPIWAGLSPNEGLSIEEIVEKTWKPKEHAPKVAEPKWGGSIDYWIHGLKNNTQLLEGFRLMSKNVDLTSAIYPHPISGPMNVIQRLEFLRFHLERHQQQVENLK